MCGDSSYPVMGGCEMTSTPGAIVQPGGTRLTRVTGEGHVPFCCSSCGP